jgi:RNA polymerase sigma factor (sigma-70 family)
MTTGRGGDDRDERFKSLYQRYYHRIVRFYVRAFRVSEEDAQELTQDAFVRLYEAMDEYRGDAEWAYLEQIARRVGYNRIRAHATGKRNADTVAIDDPNFNHEPPAPEGPDLAERQQTEIRTRQLHDAIAQLPAGQRQCILLWLKDYSYEEIATALRITDDAVKSRIRDARKLLGKRLGTTFPEDER